jgi:peptide-methionine (R)-S-oxide reductase
MYVDYGEGYSTMATLKLTLLMLCGVAVATLFPGCPRSEPVAPRTAGIVNPVTTGSQEGATMIEKIVKTDEEWRQILTPEQYRILRKAGTEPAFSSPLDHETREGTYECAACGLPLYSSKAKYDSGTGWPSFYEPVSEDAVAYREDYSLGMRRVEVLDAGSGLHLGHVFDDGPEPTGKRFCINSAALIFVPEGGDPPAIGD